MVFYEELEMSPMCMHVLYNISLKWRID